MTRNINADDIKRGAEIEWTTETIVVEDHYEGVVVEVFEKENPVKPSEQEGDTIKRKTTTRVRLEDENGDEFDVPMSTFTDVSDSTTIDSFEPADDNDHVCDECGRDDFDSEQGVAVHKGIAHDDEPELVADGGEPTADEEFDDDEIQEAIDAHAADTTVDELRDVLQTLQQSVEEVWPTHMDAVEDNAMELVAIDGDVLVFADHTNQFWNAEFDNGPLGEGDFGRGVQIAVSQLHHKWARRHTDYDWGVDDPIVVRKPDGFDAGQRLVEAVMLNLTSRGLSPRQAWAVWGVLAGNSRNNWASRMGYDSHSGVSNAVREAKEKIPLPYL